MKFDSILVPPSILTAMSGTDSNNLRALKGRYGTALGLGAKDLIYGRKVSAGEYAGWALLSTGPHDTLLYAKTHIKHPDHRYDWTEFQDGCLGGTLKPDAAVDTLHLPPPLPIGFSPEPEPTPLPEVVEPVVEPATDAPTETVKRKKS